VYLGQVKRSSGPYDEEIYTASKLSGVEPELIAGHIMAESAYRPDATHVDADGGISYGLMQVRLDTAQRLLGRPELTPSILLDPKTNILAGTKIIQNNLIKYKNGPDAIAAYNAGIPRKNTQGQYINSKGSTVVQDYVNRVSGYYNQYKSGAPFKPIVLALEQLIIPIGAVLIAGLGFILLKRSR